MLKHRAGITPQDIARAFKERRQEEDSPPVPIKEPPRRTEIKVDLGGLLSAAGWAYGQWDQYRKKLAEQSRQILELAAQRGGWLSLSHVVQGLRITPKEAEKSLAQLCQDQLAERFTAKDGSPVWVFPAFLPDLRVCAWCDGEVIGASRCPNCGGRG